MSETEARKKPNPNQPERLWLAELEARMDAVEATDIQKFAALVNWLDPAMAFSHKTRPFWQRLRWLLRG